MGRFTAKCKFCDWTEQGTGSFDAHYRAVNHLMLHHPADYTVLRAGTERVHQIVSQLSEQFGDAAPVVRVIGMVKSTNHRFRVVTLRK